MIMGPGLMLYHESTEQHRCRRASWHGQGKQGNGGTAYRGVVGHFRGNDGLVAFTGAPLLLVFAGLLCVVVAYPGGHIFADSGQGTYAYTYQGGSYDDWYVLQRYGKGTWILRS
jgi:hypothetical protein